MLSKRILTMQDLSCVGQCSLTVALPVLSAFGVETCVLPTAILSNHTMFKKWSCLDLTGEAHNIMSVWEENSFKFDTFYLGYLGSAPLMDVAKKCFKNFSADGAKVIIDPAFGDNGVLYPAFDEKYVAAMKDLIKSADIILPNLTEACFLSGIEYEQNASVEFAEKVIKKLSSITSAVIVLTGAEKDGMIGEIIYRNGNFSYVWAEKLPKRYHGTGDIFAAAFTAEYVQSGSFKKACSVAGELVAESIKATDPSHPYGVNFEYALKNLKK
ncbi:MAG: pyridoxamine kinase [Clostridia bacterium]|nr:pyridoxamine kinase [Clostridia bacterium]